ncbi:MAG: FecR domain-containing protein [Bacteroidetes bacterium]|nr:FecR domain-containing protein [Bacteroidota bacterium]
MREIWLKISVSFSIDKNETDTFWLKMKNRINLENQATEIEEISKPNRILKRFIKIAAIFVIAFGMGAVADKFLTEKNIAEPKNEYYSIEAPRGAKSFVTLADGTKIWLNAGSKISYQRSYNQHNRGIYLEGEAFFEVAKNKNIPFLVHSAGIVVKAIGTAFNVKAYPEEGIVETTLVEGSVSIESTAKIG